MTQLLDQILQQMHDENPHGRRLDPSRPPLTPSERVARSKAKKQLSQLVLGRKHGDLERISEIVVREGRRGLQPTIDPETGEVKPPRLQVTVRDALLAEKNIDSRENRVSDRQALVAIAFALTGNQALPPPEALLLDDGLTIDGDFEEIDE